MLELPANSAAARTARLQASVIEMQNVSKSFGPVQALREVSFVIAQGEVVALLGTNGAGKTTAMSVMLGLRHPTHGQVRLLGLDPHDRRARSRCGVMLQESGLPPTLSVRETITLFRSYYPHPLPLDQVLTMADLTEKAAAMVGSLSGGQRQRLYFALALCGDPTILFLDEPTVGLDVEARHSFWNQIRRFVQQGKTILLTTHYLEEADALAKRIIVIDHGRVHADASPESLKALVAGARVSFDIDRPLHPEAFAQLPVQRVEMTEQHVTLFSAEPEVVLQSLFAQQIHITHLEVVRAGLEEAFLRLTQQPEQKEV